MSGDSAWRSNGSEVVAHTSIAAIDNMASRTVLTAQSLRRSQRTALGKEISRPRNASAASSTLLAAADTATQRSIKASVPGSRAARKSGIRLKVRRPWRQYQRAILNLGGVTRS
jgi:hypothetical protein